MNYNFRKAIDSMNTLSNQMSSLFEKLKPALNRFEQNLKPMEEKLIKTGWTINLHMMPYNIIEIGELIEVDEINKYFFDYYMLNNQEQFRVLQNMCKNHLDINLVKAYEESLFAFDNKKYIICANTLVSIIEGTLSI